MGASLLPLKDPQDWRSIAECRPANKPAHMAQDEWTALWYPDGEQGRGKHADPAGYALAICAKCPVREQCHTASKDEQGVWGGVNLDKPTTRAGEKECRACGKVWTPRWANVAYCSVACKEEGTRRTSREASRRYFHRNGRRQYECIRCGLDFGENFDAWRAHTQGSVWSGGCAA